MSYHLENSQLRVVQSISKQQRNAEALKNARIILLEHILPTTYQFIEHLQESKAEIFALIVKPYSIDQLVMEKLDNQTKLEKGNEKRIGKIIKESYRHLEDSTILDNILTEAVEASKVDGKQILILEVGGYFAKPLTRMQPDFAQFFAGAVEDTTFGHNRYIEHVENISIPVFSVARSQLKEVEARFVGWDAVAAMESILRGLGVSVAGRHALVIGYGMIGSNVARALRDHGLTTSVYDLEDATNLRAFIDGFPINKKAFLLKEADIIFAATASRALKWEEMEECKNNVILASVGSKNTEFDIDTLVEQCESRRKLGDHLEEFKIPKSKNIFVAHGGTAVNFILPSLPSEILDLVFSEILVASVMLLKQEKATPKFVPGEIYTLPATNLNAIAKDWLRNMNI